MDYNELNDDIVGRAVGWRERRSRHQAAIAAALDAMNNHPYNCPCKICVRWGRSDGTQSVPVPPVRPVPRIVPSFRSTDPEGDMRAYYRSLSVRPDGCPVCGSRLIYFFNKSGRYLADESDYYWMCRKCKGKRDHRRTHPAHIHRTVR